MSSSIIVSLLWTAALGSGLMAGFYFSFSGFIMKAFSRIEISQPVAAMNAINETILRSLFMPLNNLLAKLETGSGNAQQIWTDYLRKWTSWNHLRTISSLMTCVLSTWLLASH